MGAVAKGRELTDKSAFSSSVTQGGRVAIPVLP
jgi:hypothetical protein